MKTDVSIVTGMSGSGKSSLISGMVLDAVDNGHKVMVYSGELSPKRFMSWLYLQAAGKDYVEADSEYPNKFFTRRNVREQINEWLGKNFYLHNNRQGHDFTKMFERIKQLVSSKGMDLLILDNLMTIDVDLNEKERDQWQKQAQFIQLLKSYAGEANVHIVLVCHPSKIRGIMRVTDLEGSGKIRNAVDNIFIMHRVNDDFKRLAKQDLGWTDDNYNFKATNLLEIAKDRDGGVADYFIRLNFETETKRLRNTPVENKVYGWQKEEWLQGVIETPFD